MKLPPLRQLFSGIPAACLSALMVSCAAPPQTSPPAPAGKPLTKAELPALRREFLEAMHSEPEILYAKTPSLLDGKKKWHALEQWYARDILQMVPRQKEPGWVDCHICFEVTDNHGRKRREYEWRKLGVTQ